MAGDKAEKKSLERLRSTPESQLSLEMHHLRRVLRDIAHRFVADLESDAVRVIEYMGDVPSGGKKQKEVERIVKDLENLRVKENKGKLGDLKRIRNAIQDARSRLEDLL